LQENILISTVLENKYFYINIDRENI